MPKIEQPMLAQDYDAAIHNRLLPLLATPKVDGIRAYIRDGIVWARSNKPIPNRRIQSVLPGILPEGTDFELLVGSYADEEHFQKTTSVVMSHDNPIDDLHVYIFDYVDQHVDTIWSYETRIETIRTLFFLHAHNADNFLQAGVRLYILLPVILRTPENVQTYLDRCVRKGYEGIILRKHNGTYVFGRPPASSALLLRIKPLADAEAIIVGFKELEHNDNEQRTSPTGKTVRSSKLSGKRGGATLGGFIVQALSEQTRQGTGLEFSIGGGPGLTQVRRQTIWDNREAYLGSIIRYQYLKVGTKPGGKPRMPKFVAFRDTIDLS